MSVAWTIARRELRGGLRGFAVFLACLALGVGAIAAVGSVRVSIAEGLAREGATILGGDAELSFTYRYANEAEAAWMRDVATAVSETVDFRSMAVVDRADGPPDRALTQVRGVDDLWPLYGTADLDPAMPVAEALADGGAVMERVLAERLDLAPGDTFRLGTQDLTLRAILVREPDSGDGGFGLGPRTVVARDSLASSGLITPGTLYDTQYRLRLPPGADLSALEAEARARFESARWRDRRNAAPGVEEFVDRMGNFLVLVGLAGLAVGGIGVARAVRSYLDGKTGVIATLKTLGAETRTIFAAYFLQIGVLSALGVALGLVLGTLIPLALAPVIEARLPVPAVFGVYPGPLLQAALYGVLTAGAFALWPLARAERIRAAALWRGAGAGALPRPLWIAVSAGLAAALVGTAAVFTEAPRLTLAMAGGIVAALLILTGAALALRYAARHGARLARGRPGLRAALAALGGPRSEAVGAVLSLGLGLTVLATIGQIDQNLRAAIARDLPDVAPSFFFLDIQPDQVDAFTARVADDPAVSGYETAPMLRGIVTRINDRPAREVAGDHWALQGDRGVTYAAQPRAEVVAGQWWPEDHAGPPQMAFSADEAREMGLQIGDAVTVNILGRDVTADLVALTDVDFGDAGIAFLITLSPDALAGAPHTYIATVTAEEAAEGAILRDVAGAAPNVTAIRVRDAIEDVASALRSLASATSWGAGATLLTGLVVLVGTVAAGERARVFEAAVLKTVGARRRTILGSFALRSALLGAAAGLFAIGAGALAGWAVITQVMEASFAIHWPSALAIVAGGAALTLAAGLAFAWRPLAARPARVLRAAD